MATIDWNTCPSGTSSLVDIGTHSLHLTVHGPPRPSPSDPIVIIIAGTTGTASQYPAMIRALDPTIRTVLYDRSGMGLSQTSPNKPTIQSITTELQSLLKTTSLAPPYILLGHSWGCMLSTYFISTLPSPTTCIHGLILLDGGSPTISQPSSFSTDPGTPWAHPELFQVISPADMWAVQTALPGNELTPNEMSTMAQQYATPSYQAQAQLEFAGLFASYTPFHETKLLSHSPPLLSGVPVCLVHAYTNEAFQTMYDWGVEAGRGTDEERAAIKEKFVDWEERTLENQMQLLQLTEEENRKVIMCKEHTPHNVMMFDTGSIMEGVRWVLGKGTR